MKYVIFFSLILACLMVDAADPKSIVCLSCNTTNTSQAVYCKHCGKFIGRSYPESNHLFNVSSADVLPSMDIQLAGGGAYGLESEHTLLGNLGFGLGDMAEISLATHTLFSNLGSQSVVIPASSFKVRLFSVKGWRPGVAMGFKITPESPIHESSKGFAAEVGIDESGRSLVELDYTTRFTEANLSATLLFKEMRNTLSFRVMDVRFINLSTRWSRNFADTMTRTHQIDADEPNYFYSVGLGTEITASASTRILLEVSGQPLYNLKKAVEQNTSVEFSTLFAIIGGVRFYFTDWLYINAGIKYQSDYHGLADLNLRSEINLFIPLRRLVGKNK